ncbi:hypothetical protein IEQ34_022626 [Dendrobium chrysotoxum]|uniref:H(+)-transporting two-sector ATPase n=1 Tax=Dendrobium chrysotoxum TaxID=161865 RepID=A0AAV7FXU4_DENCH|nr:hypothetical protein IEQ34_022626 [Dendrobium chrysotoxum]
MRSNPTISNPMVSTHEEQNLGRIAQIIGPVQDVIFPPGIKVVDLLAPYHCGGKIRLFEGAGVGKIVLIIELINNIAKAHRVVFVFCGVESKVAQVYGQMDELPGASMRVSLTALTMAEYFWDVNEQNILLFINNIFHFILAGSEVSTLLGRMPFAVERITSTKEGSITSIQAVYVPADDLTNLAPATTFAHLDATIDIIAILGLDKLSEEDRLIVTRACKIEHFLSQPFFVAEVFTGSPRKYVGLVERIRGFQFILSRELYGLPEQSFYLVVNIDEATAKAMNLYVESKLKK